MDRLAMLEKMVAGGSQDPFVRYGLAMEYRRLGRLAEASRAFDDLLAVKPDYLATYLMAGGVLATQQQKDRAHEVYSRGIAVARSQGNAKTLGELESALAELGLEEDEG